MYLQLLMPDLPPDIPPAYYKSIESIIIGAVRETRKTNITTKLKSNQIVRSAPPLEINMPPYITCIISKYQSQLQECKITIIGMYYF